MWKESTVARQNLFVDPLLPSSLEIFYLLLKQYDDHQIACSRHMWHSCQFCTFHNLYLMDCVVLTYMQKQTSLRS